MDHFAARLKALRKQCRLQQIDVARLTGIHQATVSRLERGTRKPTHAQLLQLAQLYQCALDDLVGTVSAAPVPPHVPPCSLTTCPILHLLRAFLHSPAITGLLQHLPEGEGSQA